VLGKLLTGILDRPLLESVRSAVPQLGETLPPIPLNSKIVFDGDSITAQGYAIAGDWFVANASWGWPCFAMPLSGGRLFQPEDGNVAVPGDTLALMYARREATIAKEPKVLAMLAGTNSITAGATEATIKAQFTQYWDYMFANGVERIVVVTILPRFPGEFDFTEPQEELRQTINAWLLNQVSARLRVVNANLIGLVAEDFADGLHTNTLGALKVGRAVATQLRSITAKGDIIDTWENEYSVNPTMAGTGGSVSGGATGVCADGFSLTAADAGGATVVGSKGTMSDGSPAQVITLSGNFTGDNRFINFSPFVTAAIGEGDTPEFISQIECSGLDGIVSIRPLIFLFTSEFATIVQTEAYTSADQIEFPADVSEMVLRTAVRTIVVPDDPPAWQVFGFNIGLKNVGAVSTPVSGVFKFGRNAGRLVVEAEIDTPEWAEGADFWRDFAANTGNEPNPVDTHSQVIQVLDSAGSYSEREANILSRSDLGLQTVPTRTQLTPVNDWNTSTPPDTFVNGGIATDADVVTTFTEGVEYGLNYIELHVVGSSAGGEAWQIYHAASEGGSVDQGDILIGSMFAKLVGGSLDNVLYMVYNVTQNNDSFNYLAGLASTTADNNVHLGGMNVLKRYWQKGTADNAAVDNAGSSLYGEFAAGPVDFTIRLYCPQIEKALYMGPPIKNPSGGSWVVPGNQPIISNLESELDGGFAGVFQVDILDAIPSDALFDFSDGSNDNQIHLARSDDNIGFAVYSGGVLQAFITVCPYVAGLQTFAFAVGTNYVNCRKVGVADPGADTTVTYPTGLDRLAFGCYWWGGGQPYARHKKMAVEYGPQDATSFAAMYEKAVLAASA
jgi:lysophospholipase L1-like esterase